MEIKAEVRKFIVENLLRHAPRVSLADNTLLITDGLIDSIGVISLVRFLEDRFRIRFGPREVDAYSFDTLEQIEGVVSKKLAPVAPHPVTGD